LSHATSPIEHQVDHLCKIIIKKTAEFWEERNKAMLDLTVEQLIFLNFLTSVRFLGVDFGI
jgi:hypothetical protein